jgi:transcriptional regulator with XRE-family HTH domain
LGRTYISNVERGRKNPSLRSLEIFATCFKMSVSEFLKGV